MLIDTHCHLDFPEFDLDREEVIQRARQEDVGCIINIGSSLRGSQAGIDLASQYDFIYTSIGIHPHEADRITKEIIKNIQQLSNKEKVVAIVNIDQEGMLFGWEKFPYEHGRCPIIPCYIKPVFGQPMGVGIPEMLYDVKGLRL